ncbi:hypothetical protein PV05_03910 [Exophiala xenobiotica]|uniref:Uncharacterized protein n=1 Tax=Exophiala xenobiotica TaxID=348802 RepID=A0A0D2EUT3_9EURO|nr:uncharacterized protein PV05_03910 [Exophiala xenobiotica]KIW59463.1 hypothetical protein PV05_03910 [Exophiala xenobiotica]
MSDRDLHTFKSHAELAAAALGSVYAANELSKALTDEDAHDNTDHYLRAAVGAAVAVGAYHQLQKKRHHDDSDSSSDEDDHIHKEHREHSGEKHHHHHPDPPGHGRHLLEEAAGAYSLGKELLGDRRHHVVHLIAEALGAVGALRDIQGRKRIEEAEHENR